MTQESLFGLALTEPVEPIRRDARISADGLYRYSLHREWMNRLDGPRWCTFVMLNPSTADALEDDPTIRRCIGFARSLGCNGLAVVNLYAYRATNPAELWTVIDPVGPENDDTLRMFFDMAAQHDFPIIAAWGTNAKPERVARVLSMPGAERLSALSVTKSGAPGHPLYLRSNLVPQPYLRDEQERSP